MLAYLTNDKNHRPPSRTVAYLLLLLTFLWAFVGTIDGPSVQFGSKSGYNVYKIPKLVDGEHSAQPWPLWIGVFPENLPPVHASFLLFDFKQNLRRWPNVAGDISRSPPFCLAV
jgi:hypothetical protein